MRRDSVLFSDPGAMMQRLVWSCGLALLWTALTRIVPSWVTSVENTQSDVWQQFTGVIDASSLGDYNGAIAEIRIVRNDNVRQRSTLMSLCSTRTLLIPLHTGLMRKGLNPYISALDLDGDGLSCLQEYVFGGDPMNRDSIGFTPELRK